MSPATTGEGDPFREFDAFVERDYPLARHTWFRIGGSARWFARPRTTDELAAISRRARDDGIPVYVLGLGANLLVSDDGVPGLVVRLDAEHWKRVERGRGGGPGGGREATLKVGGGMEMQKLVVRTGRLGLAGFERMAGIPGTIGGGLRMNAGGRYGDIGSLVREVTVLSEIGEVRTMSGDEAEFGYRRSGIAEPFILDCTLELAEDDPEAIAGRAKEIWGYKKQTQPLSAKSAGCMFKNPPDDSAGRLIDAAGCKGLRVGLAEVSDRHANFVVAHPGCGSGDLFALADEVRRRVAERFGVGLESEVRRWP
jgi:UDP-N-acetylmuramate dehydrogenase